MKIFYSYVWGRLTDAELGYPMTFTGSRSRKEALGKISNGDLIVCVASINPLDPAVTIPQPSQGRVLNVLQMTKTVANTADYGIDYEYKGHSWPASIQPFRVWDVIDPPMFRELTGYSTAVHNVAAVRSIGEIVGSALRRSVLRLEVAEKPVALPTQSPSIDMFEKVVKAHLAVHHDPYKDD